MEPLQVGILQLGVFGLFLLICATVSPWLKTRLERMADGKEFSSVSDIVSLACHEFLTRHFPDQYERPVSEKKK